MALIHLDAGVVIGLLDGNDPHHVSSVATLRAATTAGDALAMSVTAMAECLVGPFRRGDEAVDRVRDLFSRVPIAAVATDIEVATTAAQIRARHASLRLPDAFVLASAVADQADVLVTTDRRWPTPEDLGLDVELVVL